MTVNVVLASVHLFWHDIFIYCVYFFCEKKNKVYKNLVNYAYLVTVNGLWNILFYKYLLVQLKKVHGYT